jgi:malate/lactate dehydrogenase
MRIAVVGTGNVGSALLMHLTQVDNLQDVLVMNLKDEWSEAAIMDVASVNPEITFSKFSIASFCQLSEVDLIVLTSGVQMKENESGLDVLNQNIEVTNKILDQSELGQEVYIIGLATPVDKITPHIQSRYNLKPNRVMGFGGDLDHNRLVFVLFQLGIKVESVAIVGEHGEHTIPVFRGENAYPEVAKRVRHFLANITAQGGSPRNLATGWLLAKLVDSILNDKRTIHYVCAHHPLYDRYLTWPFLIGQEGILEPQTLELPPLAHQELINLLKNQQKGEDWSKW